MKQALLEQILTLNPWLKDKKAPIQRLNSYTPRIQTDKLLSDAWDELWLILIGPRRAGKTTLGFAISEALIHAKRYNTLLYLNCDYTTIRQWLRSPTFVQEAIEHFKLVKPILYIDEVQRIDSPGLLLKMIADLKLPIKMIATGSSQLEMKSKVQEHLTGRQLESVILPMSYPEMQSMQANLEKTITPHDPLIYGTYPEIITTTEKALLLQQLYGDYIRKDIIESLKIGKPDVIEQLLTLMAHSSGQLVNYNQLATDCQVNFSTIQHYLSVLEGTYVLKKITPFVGNKRTEITTNPVYYFLDNGFRNQALNNFIDLPRRSDAGFLIESAVFQEIYKLKQQQFKNFSIHYWRTKGGAEVDFVLKSGKNQLLPIEVKYRSMAKPSITRGFRSFIEAYHPPKGIIITKDTIGTQIIDHCEVLLIPFQKLSTVLEEIRKQC